MEADKKFVVTYKDDDHVFPVLEESIKAKMPIESVGQPIISTKEASPSLRSTGPRNLPRVDIEFSPVGNADNSKFVNVNFMVINDLDAYRSMGRNRLSEWLAAVNTQKYQQNLIVIIQTELDLAGAQKTTGNIFFSKILDKARNDFCALQLDGTSINVCQIAITVREVNWGDFWEQLSDAIYRGTVLKVKLLEEEARTLEVQRQLPNWNFDAYLAKKKSLLELYESVGLYYEALQGYNSLNEVFLDHILVSPHGLREPLDCNLLNIFLPEIMSAVDDTSVNDDSLPFKASCSLLLSCWKMSILSRRPVCILASWQKYCRFLEILTGPISSSDLSAVTIGFSLKAIALSETIINGCGLNLEERKEFDLLCLSIWLIVWHNLCEVERKNLSCQRHLCKMFSMYAAQNALIFDMNSPDVAKFTYNIISAGCIRLKMFRLLNTIQAEAVEYFPFGNNPTDGDLIKPFENWTYLELALDNARQLERKGSRETFQNILNLAAKHSAELPTLTAHLLQRALGQLSDIDGAPFDVKPDLIRIALNPGSTAHKLSVTVCSAIEISFDVSSLRIHLLDNDHEVVFAGSDFRICSGESFHELLPLAYVAEGTYHMASWEFEMKSFRLRQDCLNNKVPRIRLCNDHNMTFKVRIQLPHTLFWNDLKISLFIDLPQILHIDEIMINSCEEVWRSELVSVIWGQSPSQETSILVSSPSKSMTLPLNEDVEHLCISLPVKSLCIGKSLIKLKIGEKIWSQDFDINQSQIFPFIIDSIDQKINVSRISRCVNNIFISEGDSKLTWNVLDSDLQYLKRDLTSRLELEYRRKNFENSWKIIVTDLKATKMCTSEVYLRKIDEDLNADFTPQSSFELTANKSSPELVHFDMQNISTDLIFEGKLRGCLLDGHVMSLKALNLNQSPVRYPLERNRKCVV